MLCISMQYNTIYNMLLVLRLILICLGELYNDLVDPYLME